MISLEKLKNPKFLYVISLLLAVSSIFVVLLLAYMKDSSGTNSIKVEMGEILSASGAVKYNERLTAIEASVIVERQNYYVVPTSTIFRLENSQSKYYFYPESNITYLAIGTLPINININNQILELKNIKGLYDKKNNSLYILEGSLDINGRQANVNDSVTFMDNSWLVSKFDRTILGTNTKVQEIINILNLSEMTPSSLTDINPPLIEIISPQYTSTDHKNIEIKGKTDPTVILSLNNDNANLEANGDFSLDYELVEGLNRIELTANDGWNTTTLVLEINRIVPVLPEPEILNSTSNCTQGEIENQVFCLINQYRNNQGLTILEFNTQEGKSARENAFSSYLNESPINNISGEEKYIEEDINHTANILFTNIKNLYPDSIQSREVASITIGVYKNYAVFSVW